LAEVITGNSTAAKIAIIAITTNNSISVNPLFFIFTSPYASFLFCAPHTAQAPASTLKTVPHSRLAAFF
jgi:hypothetical protein